MQECDDAKRLLQAADQRAARLEADCAASADALQVSLLYFNDIGKLARRQSSTPLHLYDTMDLGILEACLYTARYILG